MSMRTLTAFLHLLLASLGALALAPVHSRPRNSTISWHSLPPSVYEVRGDCRQMTAPFETKAVLVVHKDVLRQMALAHHGKPI